VTITILLIVLGGIITIVNYRGGAAGAQHWFTQLQDDAMAAWAKGPAPIRTHLPRLGPGLVLLTVALLILWIGQGQRPWAERRWLRWSTALVLGIGVLSVRHWLAASGTVYGTGAFTALTVGAVALLALVVFFCLRHELLRDNQGSGRLNFERLAVVVGLGAAIFSGIETVAPLSPDLKAAPACSGAQTRGVPFLATTLERGVNVRSGASRNFEQLARFAGDCTLGFVGYCWGDPEPDNQDQVPDSRWLLLPKQRGLISAANLQSQVASSRLPLTSCPGGREPPTQIQLEIPKQPGLQGAAVSGAINLSARAPGADLVGFAAYRPATSNEERPRIIWVGHSEVDKQGIARRGRYVGQPLRFAPEAWNTATIGQGEFLVAAVICLAAEVPYTEVAPSTRRLIAGSSTTSSRLPATAFELSPEDRTRVMRAACRLPTAAEQQPA
jgi:hypothetical protein